MPGNYTVPPPPPKVPFDLGLDEDRDYEAEQMLASMFPDTTGPGPQPLPGTEQPAAIEDDSDPEAEEMLMGLMSEKPATKETPKPKPAATTPTATRKKPLSKVVAGQKPAGVNPLVGVDQMIGQAGQALHNLPGPFGPAFKGMTEQANMASRELAANPGQALAATAAGVPIGLAGLADAGLNTAARTMFGGAPFNFEGLVRGATFGGPTLGQIADAAPGSSGTGAAAGASTVPLAFKLPIKNQVLKHATSGAIAGEVLGAAGSAGEQARHGPVDFGKAATEGLPVALIGGGLGAGAGAVGAGISRATKPRPKAAPPPPKVDVKLNDGSEFTAAEAITAMRDPATPPGIRFELQQKLKESNASNRPTGGRKSRKKKEEAPKLTEEQEARVPQNQAADYYMDAETSLYNQAIYGDQAGPQPQYTSAWQAMGKTRPGGEAPPPVTGYPDIRPPEPAPKTPQKKAARAKPLTRPTVFDDMIANPEPAEIEARYSNAIKNAASRTELDTVANDAAKMISRNVRDPELRKRMMNRLNGAKSDWSLQAARNAQGEVNVRPGDFAAEQAKLDELIAADQAEAAKQVIPDNNDIPRTEADDLFPNARNEILVEPRDRVKDKGDSGAMFSEDGDFVGYVAGDGGNGPSWRPSEAPEGFDFDAEIKRVEGLKASTELQKSDRAQMLKTLRDEQGRRGWIKANGMEPDWPAAEVFNAEPPVRRRFGKGASGDAAFVEFATKADAELYDYSANQRKSQTGNNRAQFSVDREKLLAGDELAQRAGVTSDDLASLPLYNKHVRELAKATAADETVQAPSFKDWLAQQKVASSVEEQPQARFTVNRTKTGTEIVDSTTGEVVSSNNNGLEANHKRADQLNRLEGEELEKALRKGSKNMLNFKQGEPGVRKDIIARGKPLAADHPQRADYEALADAKHNFDEARAKFYAAVDAYDALTGQKTPTKTTKVDAKYSEDVENFVQQVLKDGGAGELTIEVQNSKKIEPQDKARFKRGTTEADAFAQVEELHSAYKIAKDALVEARRPIKDDAISMGSTNIPHPKGEVNVRVVPKQGTETNAIATEMRGPLPEQNVLDRSITRVRTYHKEQANADYNAVATSTKPVVRRPRGMRGQGGSVMLTNFRGKGKPAPPEKIEPVEAALAKGVQEDAQIKDWANDAEKLKALFTTRNTLDMIKDVGEVDFGDGDIVNLHSEVWRGIAEEVNLTRKLEKKFDFDNDLDLIESTRKMTPEEIWDGGPEGELLKFDGDQLNALAQIKEIRAESAELLRDSAEHILEPYGEKEKMPNKIRNQYDVMNQLADAMDGRTRSSNTNELSIIQVMQRGLYDYVFRWNPKYHGLNLLDPLIVGSARVGIDKVAAAKLALQTDPTIRKFIKSIPSESLNQQARKEALFQSETPIGVEETMYGRAKRGLARFQAKLPDLIPSERWNFEDAITAGLIQKGDLVYGKGKGLEYLRDLAEGKLTQEQEVEAFIHSLEVADDITGAATLGLNKTALQRAGYSSSFAQLVGQQTRVARMLRNFVATGAIGSIVTFAATNILFGGRSVLPYETEILKAIPQLKPLIENLEDILDWVPDNTTERIPFIGRDLSKKLRYSAALPWGGGIGGSMLLETVEKFMSNWQGGKWDAVSKFALLMAISNTFRGGGLELDAITRNAQAVQEGDKKLYAFGMGSRPKGQSTWKDVTKRKFGMFDFLRESTLTGSDPKVGDWEKEQLRK